jgi:predicted enzyme related to lactoylglutathione lyase
MAEQTAHALAAPADGTFCWTELATTNLEASRKFYTELLGWQLKEGQSEGMIYNEISAGGRGIGGMYQTGPEQGDAPSQWVAYVAVEDVDAKAKQVEELGGKVCVPPTDIPNVGRFCVINDPTGASIALITLKGA